jgi:LysR family hca operon transcriptional activator
MDLDTRLLRYFLEVAEELNVTRAAEKLHTAQPALSQQIRLLERIVGVPLFHRDRGRLHLTEAGKGMIPKAKLVLVSVDNALQEAQTVAQKLKCTITLGCIPGPEQKIFSHLVPLMLRCHPAIRLIPRTMYSPEQLQALDKRELVAGFLRGPVENREIASEIYMREDVLAVIPQDSPLAELDRVPVSELAKMSFISHSVAVAPAMHKVSKSIEERAGVKFRTAFRSENITTSLNAVAAGIGFTFFPAYVADVVPRGVVARSIDLAPAPQLDLQFAYRIDDGLPALHSVTQLIKAHSPYRMAQRTPDESVRIGSRLEQRTDYEDTACVGHDRTTASTNSSGPVSLQKRICFLG